MWPKDRFQGVRQAPFVTVTGCALNSYCSSWCCPLPSTATPPLHSNKRVIDAIECHYMDTSWSVTRVLLGLCWKQPGDACKINLSTDKTSPSSQLWYMQIYALWHWFVRGQRTKWIAVSALLFRYGVQRSRTGIRSSARTTNNNNGTLTRRREMVDQSVHWSHYSIWPSLDNNSSRNFVLALNKQRVTNQQSQVPFSPLSTSDKWPSEGLNSNQKLEPFSRWHTELLFTFIYVLCWRCLSK